MLCSDPQHGHAHLLVVTTTWTCSHTCSDPPHGHACIHEVTLDKENARILVPVVTHDLVMLLQ